MVRVVPVVAGDDFLLGVLQGCECLVGMSTVVTRTAANEAMTILTPQT
jgi:hypothetical protein